MFYDGNKFLALDYFIDYTLKIIILLSMQYFTFVRNFDVFLRKFLKSVRLYF